MRLRSGKEKPKWIANVKRVAIDQGIKLLFTKTTSDYLKLIGVVQFWKLPYDIDVINVSYLIFCIFKTSGVPGVVRLFIYISPKK